MGRISPQRVKSVQDRTRWFALGTRPEQLIEWCSTDEYGYFPKHQRLPESRRNSGGWSLLRCPLPVCPLPHSEQFRFGEPCPADFRSLQSAAPSNSRLFEDQVLAVRCFASVLRNGNLQSKRLSAS